MKPIYQVKGELTVIIAHPAQEDRLLPTKRAVRITLSDEQRQQLGLMGYEFINEAILE